MTANRHELILLCERLRALHDTVQSARFAAGDIDPIGAVQRNLRHAEDAVMEAWMAAEKEAQP